MAPFNFRSDTSLGFCSPPLPSGTAVPGWDAGGPTAGRLFNALTDAERLEEAHQAYTDLLNARPDAVNDWHVLRLARLILLNGNVDGKRTGMAESGVSGSNVKDDDLDECYLRAQKYKFTYKQKKECHV